MQKRILAVLPLLLALPLSAAISAHAVADRVLQSTPAPTGVAAVVFACTGGGPNATGSVKVSWEVVAGAPTIKTSAAIVGVDMGGRLGPYTKGYLEIYPVPQGTYRVDVVNLNPDPNHPGSYLPSATVSVTLDFDKTDCPKGNGNSKKP